MNQIAKIAPANEGRPSMLAAMASKYNMDPDQFTHTVRSTVMPAQHTNEQFAALMLVAREYDLNPIVKEIYAFPAKGGGIVPVVSIDGWLNLVNSHPATDGFEIEFEDDKNGDPVSCTCRMYRKDRNRPVTVTEYLSECIRNTDPWKMKHRMLRHKAVIQAARYAFGFSGIYDEDEGAKIAETQSAAPPPPATPKIADATFEEVRDPTSQPSPTATHAAPEAAEKAAPPPPDPGAARQKDTNRFFLDGAGTVWDRRTDKKVPPQFVTTAGEHGFVVGDGYERWLEDLEKNQSQQKAAPPPTPADDIPLEPDAFIEEMRDRMQNAPSEDDVIAVWHEMSPEDILVFSGDRNRAQQVFDEQRDRFRRGSS